MIILKNYKNRVFDKKIFSAILRHVSTKSFDGSILIIYKFIKILTSENIQRKSSYILSFS